MSWTWAIAICSPASPTILLTDAWAQSSCPSGRTKRLSKFDPNGPPSVRPVIARSVTSQSSGWVMSRNDFPIRSSRVRAEHARQRIVDVDEREVVDGRHRHPGRRGPEREAEPLWASSSCSMRVGLRRRFHGARVERIRAALPLGGQVAGDLGVPGRIAPAPAPRTTSSTAPRAATRATVAGRPHRRPRGEGGQPQPHRHTLARYLTDSACLATSRD